MIALFFGGLVIFLYGQKLIERNLQKTSRLRLRSILKLLTKHRITSLILGGVFSAGAQSSTVAVITLVSFINGGLLQLNQALGLVLGAGLGTTLAIQVISLNVASYALWIIIIGFFVSKIHSLRGYYESEFLLGLGFIFFGIYLMGNGVVFFRETQIGADFLSGVCTMPGANFIISFFLTVVCQSTLLPLGVGVTLMRDGGVPLDSVLPIIFGAHLGAGILPLVLCFRSQKNNTAKQVAFANMAYRIAGVLLFLPLMHPLSETARMLTRIFAVGTPAAAGRQLANAHTLFTIATVLVFFPFLGGYAALMKKLFPDKKTGRETLLFLKPGLENTAKEILPAAEKEICNLAKYAENMLCDSLCLWEGDDLRSFGKIKKIYEQIRRMSEGIARYLTKLPREDLTDAEYKQELRLLDINISLGRIGELSGRNLVYIAKERIMRGLVFSIEGLGELLDMHRQVIADFRKLSGAKHADKIQDSGNKLSALFVSSYNAHINRMHKGFFATRDTDSLHIDAVNVLERIHGYILKIAEAGFEI